MVKRVYIESVKNWGITSGVSAATVVGLLFAYLTFMGAIEITGFSGDQVCAGTIDDPCYAYINFTANEDIFIYPIGYDPWGRETIFKFSPGVKDWKLQRSWGTGWRDIPLNKTCTGTWCGAPNSDGVTYSWVLRKGRDYQVRVVALKNSPSDTIKWAVNYEDREYLDPTWLPIQNWTIDGNKVFINDSRAYIEVYPHTAKQGEWVTFNFTSKIYSGDVDIVFGFDKSEMRANGVRKYNPTNETMQKSYACDHEFNYTLSPKYATCYQNVSYIDNQTGKTGYETWILFDGEFETGDIETQTVYWTENYTDKYKSVSNNVFNSVDYSYNGIDKWYYYKNLEIEQGVANAYQVKLESIDPWGTNSKYWFGIKPSNLTLQEAISQDKFYSIDPWTEDLDLNLTSFYNFDEQDTTGSGTILDSLSVNDGVNFGTDNTTGKIKTAYDFERGNTDFINSTVDTNGVFSVSFWAKFESFGSAGIYDNTIIMDGGTTWSLAFRAGDIGGSVYRTEFIVVDSGGTAYKVQPAINLVTDQWYHFVGTYDGETSIFYINGTNVGSNSAISGSKRSNDHALEFGRDFLNGRYFDGVIDEAGIWERDLNSSEVTQLYNNGNGISYVAPSDAPTLTANVTRPEVVYTNTDWLINITATNENESYMDAYTQFYVNDSAVGDEIWFNLTNNTNQLISTLLSGNFSGGNTLIAEVWVGNEVGNSTKVNLTEVTVQYFNISGTLKDGDSNNLNASVFVVNQSDNSLVGNTTSLNGIWTFGPVLPGTYIVTGYDPSDSTLDGDAEPHVVVPV